MLPPDTFALRLPAYAEAHLLQLDTLSRSRVSLCDQTSQEMFIALSVPPELGSRT